MTRLGGGHHHARAGHEHLIIVGGQRCGTTWLQQVLAMHPDVRLPIIGRPEPKFFLDRVDHDEYDALFQFTGGSWLLDKSTTYLERAGAAARARVCIPGALIVVVVRDPVERAYSDWRFSVANGLEELSFAESLSCGAQQRRGHGLSTSPYQSLRRGCYAELIEPWYRAFRSHLVVLQYERTVAPDEGAYVAEQLAQIGLTTPEGWPEVPPPANAAPSDQSMPADQRLQLQAYYGPINERLVDFGVDLDLWSR